MSTEGNEHCGQIGTLGKMDPGRDGDREKIILSAYLSQCPLVLLSLSVL